MRNSSSRSYIAGGQENGNDDQPYGGGGGGGQQYEATGGKKCTSSRLKCSGSSKKEADADADYPKYAGSNNEADDHNHYSGGTAIGAPYCGGGGYGNSSPYGTGGGYALYNDNGTTGFWAPQNGTSGPPMFIGEVHVYGAPGCAPSCGGYDNDNSNDDHQQRRGGDDGSGGGLFGPLLHKFGNFLDGKLGLEMKNTAHSNDH